VDDFLSEKAVVLGFGLKHQPEKRLLLWFSLRIKNLHRLYFYILSTSVFTKIIYCWAKEWLSEIQL